MNNVMIDLETLGNGELGVFPVLCAYEFDPKTGKTGRDFYRNVSVHDQVEAGREIDPDTIEWWFRQGEDARAMLMAPGDRLSRVLRDFEDWMPKDAIVWSKGIDFDLPKLRTAYRNKIPWKYWNQRDMRTVMNLACAFDPKEVPFVGIKHCAKDDVLHQIKILHLALCSIGLAEYNEQ